MTFECPCAVATWTFGKPAVELTGRLLSQGVDLLDAIEQGIVAVELDTSVGSVGYGGAPNSAGIMELDAAIMDGRDHRVGSVAGLRGCRTPISVARRVLERSRHSMLVGEGASEFARAEGLNAAEALSPEAAERFRAWRESQRSADESHDTIGLIAVDAKGNVAAGCSTSGLAFKDPGRVGDSPIIGSGLYADNGAGAAVATGNGDEIVKFCMSFLAVELMRAGASPDEACASAICRYQEQHPERAAEHIALIAVAPSGEYGAAAQGGEFPFAVWTRSGCGMHSRRAALTPGPSPQGEGCPSGARAGRGRSHDRNFTRPAAGTPRGASG